MKKSAMTAVRDCLGIKPEETLLILTDPNKKSIAEALFDAARKCGAEPYMLMMWERDHHGEEPPAPIPELMKMVSAVIAPTTYSVSHTQARKEACKAGVRIGTMPMITEGMMNKGAMTADFPKMKAWAEKLHVILKRSNRVHVTTALGTDVTLNIPTDKWTLDTGVLDKPGSFGNLPGGEVFLPPTNVNGVLVVDGAFSGYGLVDKPVKITIKDNYAQKIEGGKAAKKIQEVLEKASKPLADPNWVFNMAEFGIGINPKAKLIGNPLEDEKVIGTFHMALGDNSTFGGNIRANVHLDGIVKRPTITVGDTVIMKGGKFVAKL